MKEFVYKILNPGGNKTALVIGDTYSNIERKTINDIILKENNDVEQVGFISRVGNKLEMAGGEFCINATRCAIWEYLNNTNRKANKKINIKVSGCEKAIEGGIDMTGNVYAKIEINKRIPDFVALNDKFNYINLDGILHAVVDEENSKEYIKQLMNNQAEAKRRLKNIMKIFDTTQNAVGIILLEKVEEKLKIFPIVWVKTIDSLFYETACGSGSLAVAIYKNYVKGTKSFRIIHPSGYTIEVSLQENLGYVKEATISGKVIEEKGGFKYGRI